MDLLKERREHSSSNLIKKETIDYDEDEKEIPIALQNVSVSIEENKCNVSELEETMSNRDHYNDTSDSDTNDETHEREKQKLRKDFLQVFLNEDDNRTSDNAESSPKAVEIDPSSSYDNLKINEISIPSSKQTGRKHKARVVELLKCDDCDKMFTKLGQLKSHKINRHGEKSHICEFCQKGFRTKIHLKRHVVTHSKKRFICKGCSASYFTKEELDAHVKAEKHDKLKLCPECGLRCKTNDKLKVHMRRHTGEKPYMCRYCNKGFPRSDELRAHERCHTGEKSHFCNVCGKGFQKKYYLDKHSHVHGNNESTHKCSRCQQEFEQSDDLKTHNCSQITAGKPNNTITIFEQYSNFC